MEILNRDTTKNENGDKKQLAVGDENKIKSIKLRELWEWFKNLPAEVLWKTLSYLTSSVIVLPNITLAMFVIYMGENGFFSYDFFTQGVFGMKLFFFTTMAMMVVSAAVLWGPAFVVYARRRGKDIPRFFQAIVVFVAMIAWIVVLEKLIYQSSVDAKRVYFSLGVSLILGFHLGVLIFLNAKQQFISLLVITSSILYISLNWSEQAEKVIGIGLVKFGMGGDLPIEITDAQTQNVTYGTLKLITPEKIYFIPEGKKGVSTYQRGAISQHYIGSKSETEKNKE